MPASKGKEMNVISASLFQQKRKRRSKAKIPMGAGLRAELEKQMGKVGYALHELMTRSKIPAVIKNEPVILDPEQRLSVELADRLRALTLQYYETGGAVGLRAVWCHVANERKAGWFTMILLRAMGMLAGAPDYWFVWDGGGCLIELKVDGDLSPAQINFRAWAGAFLANACVCRSIDAVVEALIGYGAIVGIPGRGALDVTE